MTNVLPNLRFKSLCLEIEVPHGNTCSKVSTLDVVREIRGAIKFMLAPATKIADCVISVVTIYGIRFRSYLF